MPECSHKRVSISTYPENGVFKRKCMDCKKEIQGMPEVYIKPDPSGKLRLTHERTN